MKNFVKTSLICFFLFSFACGPKEGHDTITIVNNSNERIPFQVRIIYDEIYPSDTIYDCGIGIYGSLKDTYYLEAYRNRSWEVTFKSTPFIQIFMLNDSVHKNVPCNIIRKYNMILHRYQLTLEDLQRMDWTVVYPPDSELPIDSVQ